MESVTKCRFCQAEFGGLKAWRDAYCDKHCRTMGAIYGTVRNWQFDVIPTRITYNKTDRKNAPRAKDGTTEKVRNTRKIKGISQIAFDLDDKE